MPGLWGLGALGALGAWLHGCLGACGCFGALGAWLLGCLGARVLGCLDALVLGSLDAWVLREPIEQSRVLMDCSVQYDLFNPSLLVRVFCCYVPSFEKS